MNTSNIYFLVFSAFLASACAAEFLCYSCDPKSKKSQCQDPIGALESEIICENEPTATDGFKKIVKDLQSEIVAKTETNDRFTCYSLILIPNNQSSYSEGIYRGCVDNTDTVRNFCDRIKDSAPGNITSCEECNSDKCNSRKLQAPGSAAAVSISLFLLFINALLCVYILDF